MNLILHCVEFLYLAVGISVQHQRSINNLNPTNRQAAISFSFKKFVEFVSLEDDPTDEQITEIFGIFQNNDKAEKLKAEREKLRKDAAVKIAAHRAKRDLEAQARAKNDQRPAPVDKSARGPSAASAGRAAERDWVASMEGVELTEAAILAFAEEMKAVDTIMNVRGAQLAKNDLVIDDTTAVIVVEYDFPEHKVSVSEIKKSSSSVKSVKIQKMSRGDGPTTYLYDIEFKEKMDAKFKKAILAKFKTSLI